MRREQQRARTNVQKICVTGRHHKNKYTRTAQQSQRCKWFMNCQIQRSFFGRIKNASNLQILGLNTIQFVVYRFGAVFFVLMRTALHLSRFLAIRSYRIYIMLRAHLTIHTIERLVGRWV